VQAELRFSIILADYFAVQSTGRDQYEEYYRLFHSLLHSDIPSQEKRSVTSHDELDLYGQVIRRRRLYLHLPKSWPFLGHTLLITRFFKYVRVAPQRSPSSLPAMVASLQSTFGSAFVGLVVSAMYAPFSVPHHDII
jgi:hypothetical protein